MVEHTEGLIESILGIMIVSVAAFIVSAGALSISSASEVHPQEEWNRTFGSGYGDGAWSVQATSDGGYIFAGHTCSRGMGSDLWLVKVDPSGSEIWNATFGGSGEDLGYFVRQASDGGYIVAGSTMSYGIGDEYLWLLKADALGNKTWDRTFGGFASSSGDGGWAVDEAEDGGYVVAGYTKSHSSGGKDLWLLKTDANGEKAWDRVFGGKKDAVGMSIRKTEDGGFIVAGRTNSFGSGGNDIWLLKVNSTGSEEWNRTFGGQKEDVALQVEEALDGGYVVVGRTETADGNGNTDGDGNVSTLLIKTDSSGEVQWEKGLGQDVQGVATSLALTSDGGYILAGREETPVQNRDLWIVKVNSTGEVQWETAFGGSGDDIATSVQRALDGSFIVAGITDSYGSGSEDAWLLKIKPENVDIDMYNVTKSEDVKIVSLTSDDTFS